MYVKACGDSGERARQPGCLHNVQSDTVNDACCRMRRTWVQARVMYFFMLPMAVMADQSWQEMCATDMPGPCGLVA